jgi:hypothetical protein
MPRRTGSDGCPPAGRSRGSQAPGSPAERGTAGPPSRRS